MRRRATPYLFVHGFGTDSRAWDGSAAALRTPHLMVNLPGHGGLTPWDEPTLGPAVKEILESAQGGVPVVGVGWSLGAMALIEAAVREPGAFSGLVLVGASPCFTTKEGFPWAMSPALVRRMMLDMRKDAPRALNRFLRLNFTAEETGLPEVRAFLDAFTGIERGQTAFRYGEIIVALEALLRADLRGAIERLKTPSLVVHGSSDAICGVEAGKRLAAGIEGAEFLVIEGAGHAPFVTRQARFVGAVERFAERLGA